MARITIDVDLPPGGRPNSHDTSRHLAGERATLYISPLGCPGRVHRNPANAHGWPRDSLQKAPSVKSLACLEQDRTQPLSWSSVKWRLMTQLLGLPRQREAPPVKSKDKTSLGDLD